MKKNGEGLWRARHQHARFFLPLPCNEETLLSARAILREFCSSKPSPFVPDGGVTSMTTDAKRERDGPH